LEEHSNPGKGGRSQHDPVKGTDCLQLDPGKGDDCSSAHGEHAWDTDLTRRGYACCGSPGRAEQGRTLSRVAFIGSGLVAAAGAFGAQVARASASSAVQVWGLDPNWDGGDPASCGCGACSSCRSHASNKWFASAAAADAGRAHPFCKCGVVPLLEVDESIYGALFIDGGGHASVDLRHQWVQAVLAQVPDGPDPEPLAAGTAVQAIVRPLPIRPGVSGRRVLFIDIHSREPVTATITVTREGKTLAHKAVRGVRGTRRIRLDIPPHTRPGPARLRLKLRNSAGVTKVITRGIQIPRAIPVSKKL
jgi:hypothetical protein